MNTHVDPHPTPNDLVSLAQEKIGKKKTQRILDHCKGCAPCADLLLEAVRDQSLPGERSKLTKWNWISIGLLIASLLGVLGAMIWLLNSTRPDVPVSGMTMPPAAETMYVEQPATWFEDAFSHSMVSPDGERMLHVSGLGVRLIDLPTGQEQRDALLGDFDEVMGATFDGRGELARFANRRRDLGWFLGAGEDERLSSIPPDGIPVWSRNNAHVLWTRPPARRLYIDAPPHDVRHDVDGRVLGMAWSPAGDAAYGLVMNDSGSGSLVRVAGGDPQLHTVREGLDASALPNGLAVHPDGRSVLVALASAEIPEPAARHRPQADRDLDIYALDVESGRLQPIVVGPGDDFWPWVAGGYLYWTHNDYESSVVMLPVNAAAGEGSPPVAENVVGAAAGFAGAALPRWSADGRSLSFAHGLFRLADWGLNLDVASVAIEQGRRRAAPVPLIVGPHKDFSPAASPDGRWLAYHSHRSESPVPYYAGPGVRDDIFLRRVGDEAEIRLTDFGWEVGSPDWAPDSRSFVFDSWERGGVPDVSRPWIATIAGDTGELIAVERLQLPTGVSGSVSAYWSPVSDELALVERLDPGRQALWLMDLGSGSATRLAEFASATRSGADWMPDGSAVVYSALEGGRLQLFAVSRDGGTPWRLSDDADHLLHPQVSPDGQWLAATRLSARKEVRRLPLR